MKYSAIDIGTNSIKHSIYDHRLSLLQREIFYIRIGEDIEKKWLSTEKTQKALSIITKLTKLSDKKNIHKTIIVGTSAIRACKNGTSFARCIRSSFAVPFKILSGKEEARLTFAGASHNLKRKMAKKGSTFIDIGAGSSEIILTKDLLFSNAESLEIGALRIKKKLKRRPFTAGKVLPLVLNECPKKFLEKFKDSSVVVGIGGSFTTAARILLRQKIFDASLIEKKTFVPDDFIRLEKKLAKVSIKDIQKTFSLNRKRADLVHPGLALINAYLSIAKPEKIFVSTEGVGKGAVITYLKK